MSRSYYVYLTEEAWIDAWVDGGDIPINPASAYLADVREGTKTPDETVQKAIKGMSDWIVGGGSGQGRFRIGPGAELTINNITIDIDGGPQEFVRHGHASHHIGDGLILSMSTRLDGQIAERLGKRACVEIRCMACLIEALDEQIGVKCKWGSVAYRDGYARNHFLKATADAWQSEYRLLWLTPDVAKRIVRLPPNIASRVCW